MTVKEFLIEKSNNPNINIFCKPTEDKEAIEILTVHFLGEDWYSANPIHRSQILTEQVSEIITSYESLKFRKYPIYKRLFLKIYCWLLNIPIYTYY